MCYSKWIFLISFNIYLASDLSKFQNYFFLIILKDRSIPNTYELVVSNCWGMTRGRKYLIRMCHIIMSAFLSYWKCLWNVEIVFRAACIDITFCFSKILITIKVAPKWQICINLVSYNCLHCILVLFFSH